MWTPNESNAKLIASMLRYWDLPYENFKNSYVDLAVDTYGFYTLAIDRFGVGNSTVADPVSIVQAPVTLSSIYGITKMLRNGAVPSIPYAFSKVVHVGQYFRSFILLWNDRPWG